MVHSLGIEAEAPKEKMTMVIQGVLIDQREPHWVQQLKFGDAPTAVVMLDTGDLHVACADGTVLIIERKTPEDLLASIGDGRLFNQAANMIATSPWSYIVITGYIAPSTTGRTMLAHQETQWDYNAIQGALITAQELGVRVVFTANESDFAACIVRLAKRGRSQVSIKPTRQAQLLSPGAQVLSSLPGIGLDRALDLLKQFPNAAYALAYLTAPDWPGEHITGIGNGIRNGVRQALGLEENLKLDLTTIGETNRV